MSFAIIFTMFTNLLLQGDTTSSPWPYQHVDKRARLSNSAITSVFMDRYDHIWLGSWDGLNQYDGNSIKVYKPDPFLEGTISNNVIRNFLEDGHGDLWVITHHGINKYDRTTDSFKRYLDVMNDIPLIEYNIRACVAEDSTIWASLIGQGISRYSTKEDAFKPVIFTGLDKAWLASVINLGNHNGLFYFLGSDNKLVCTVNNRLVFGKQLNNSSKLSFHKFLQLGEKYFLGVATDDGELLLYDLAEIEKQPQHLQLGPVIVSSISENLDHSSIWIGTESGSIFKVNLQGDRFIATSMNAYFPVFSKARIKILTITETTQDLLWVGTDGDGVYKFLTRPKPFYSVVSGEPKKGELSHNIVRSVFEDESGTLFIGTRGGGLNIKYPNDNATKIINTRSGLSNDAVLALNKDHEGNIWVGTDGEGIDMIEAKTGKNFHFPSDFENKNDLLFSSVYAICIDSYNDVWLGTSGFGIIHLKVIKTAAGKYRLKEYDQLKHSGKVDQISIKSNIVYTIVEEKPNVLWFGTRGGGIYRYNSLTKQIEDHIEADGNKRNGLCNDDVLSMHIDNQEQLWIGSSGGLNRLYLQMKPYRIDHFTEHDGLPNNTIHAIQEDFKNNIWLSTNQGLVMYDPGKNSFKNFDTNDGLQNNEFTDGASFKSSVSQKLFFGGVDGLDIVYPAKIDTTRYFPRLAITEFQIRNVTVTPRDNTNLLSENIDFTENIALSHDQNFISFFFTTLDYWNKQKSEYAYFLENFDKGWNNIGPQQSVTFTNIPPGQYTLNIKYSNGNGAWSPVARTIHIRVAPPFWKTAWAYTLYFFLAIAVQVCIVLYIRWRMRTKKAMAIDKFKALQLKELNDYKLQFFTNIAHEFRTPLTLILGPITSLLKKSNGNGDSIQLKTIYSNSLRLQKLIEELIQFRKIESGKDTLEISQHDLIPFAHEIVESFQQYVTDRELHLEFHPAQETLPAYFDKKKVEKILINLISNAIKYSLEGGSVSVSLKELAGKAIFIIRDEGIGIADENQQKIFESFYQNPDGKLDLNGFAKSTGIGLSLTKSLVQLHQGHIQVASKIGKGSTFTVTLPIVKEFYPNQLEEHPVILPSINLNEKVSLEFETNHYLTDPSDHTVNGKSETRLYSVLVVDDNVSITFLLEDLLSEKYTVHKAVNGKKALALLDEHRIDLVISDVLMPDMDGLTLCKKIKENIQTSHIPVILLTAKAEIENRIEGLQVGADSYIPKPFHPEHLFIRIEKLIERMELTRKKFQNFAEVELHQLSPGIGERDDHFFSKITQCILSHLSEPEFNADTIADEVGMSKASLYKKVKTITGLTPHGLIKQYRLKKAADLLKNSNMSVSEVIYETGFNSRSYFYKSFNDVFHCHPKDFAAQHLIAKGSPS
jgi:signal transduction histidine kinase/CheY-like chemotaxis protein/ligand-binding sensor domain-containing protein/AraC-like DNA-binding protein